MKKYKILFNSFDFREGQIVTETDILSRYTKGYLAYLKRGNLIEEIAEPETETGINQQLFYNINIDEHVGYFVEKERCDNNPNTPFTEEWHNYNLSMPEVKTKVVGSEEKLFSIKDLQKFIDGAESNNGSPFARRLGKDIMNNALLQLI